MKQFLFFIVLQLSTLAGPCSDRYNKLFQEAVAALGLNHARIQLLCAQKNPTGPGMYFTHREGYVPTHITFLPKKTIYLSEEFCATLDDAAVKKLLINCIKKLH